MLHDFSELYSHYPAVIAQMDTTFTSHEFILRLAQQHQAAYIEALYTYRHSTHRGGETPFRVVHKILSERLSDHPELVIRLGDIRSVDIFGGDNDCAEWRKV